LSMRLSEKAGGMLPRLLVGCLTIMLPGQAIFAQKAGPGQASAKIVGRVLDPQGIPVAEAMVVARCGCVIGRLPDARTDSVGRFSIQITVPGTYVLYAAKQDQFFPLTGNPFYDVASVRAPKLAVKDTDVLDAGAVMLHSQAGQLAVRVVDAETGKGVRGATVEFRRDDDPNADMVADTDRAGRLTELVPAAPLRIEVKAVGYEDCFYGADCTKEHSSLVYVDAKATKRVTIALRRAR